jgi:hypothetical protein
VHIKLVFPAEEWSLKPFTNPEVHPNKTYPQYCGAPARSHGFMSKKKKMMS